MQIRKHLQLPSIVCVFDQALYAKAAEIVWSRRTDFPGIILSMGVFHTICTLLRILGKRFADAGLRDLLVEAGVVAQGSVSTMLEGRHYNGGVCAHKLVFEALMRLAWIQFYKHVETLDDDSRILIFVLSFRDEMPSLTTIHIVCSLLLYNAFALVRL